MFLKLIKYDISVGAKKYFMLSAFMAFLFISLLISHVTKIDFLFSFSMFLTVFCSIGFLILYLFVVVMHNYSQLAGNQAYLTYVLPVAEWKILLSKLISSFIWGVYVFVIEIVMWFAIIRLLLVKENVDASFDSIKGILESAGFDLSTVIFIGIIFLVCYIIFILSLILFSATISVIPVLKNKNKGIIAGIITFVVLYEATGLIELLMYWIFVLKLNVNFGDINAMMTDNPFMISDLFIVISIVYAVVSVALFYLSGRILKKHRTI